MNRYALLKDSINDSIFGVVVDSNGLSKFHGVSAKGIEWSKWANGISVKSENSGLPIGVVVGGYTTLRNTNPNYVQALVDTVSLRNPSINKKQGISDSLIKNSSSIVPNVRDAELRAFDIDKRNEAIAFKARAFRTDSKVSSLLTQVRAERLGFVSAEGVFSSRNPIHTPEVKQAEIIDSYGRSLQRAIGLSLIRKKSVKMLAVVRKDQALAKSFGLEVKAAGIGPKIGSGLGGGLRAAPAGMSFVDVTGVTDADTDGIVFEGKPGLERPIIPRFMVPKDLARKLSGIVEGDAEVIEKQRRAGNTSVQFDEGKLRNIVASVGGDASLLQAVNNDRGVPATTTSGRERVSVAARNVAGNIGSRRREIASRRGMRSRDDALLDDYFRGEIERMSDRDRNNLLGRYEGEEFSGAESIGDFNPTESGAVSLLRRDRLEARGGNDFGDPKPLSSSELQKLSESELVNRLIEDRYAGLTLEDTAEKYGLKGGRAEARRLEAREMSRRDSGMRSRINTIEGIGTTEPYRRQLAERAAEITGKEPVLNGRLLRISRLVSYEPGKQGHEDMANEIANHVAETRDAIYDAVLSGDIDTEEANDYIYEMFNNLESSLKEVFGVEDRGGVWSDMTTPAQQKFEEDFASDAAKRFERAAANAESMRNLKEQGIYSDAAYGPSMFEPRQGEDLIDESDKYLDQELSDLRNWSEDNPLADAGEAWDRWADEVRKETGYLEDASLNEHVDTFLREEETDFLNAAYRNQQQHLGSRADAVMRGVGMRSRNFKMSGAPKEIQDSYSEDDIKKIENALRTGGRQDLRLSWDSENNGWMLDSFDADGEVFIEADAPLVSLTDGISEVIADRYDSVAYDGEPPYLSNMNELLPDEEDRDDSWIKEYPVSGMRSRSDYDSSLSRNGWTKNGDKWNKGNWEVEVLVDENNGANRLVARNKEIGETLEQERGADVGALKHLNVFESILRGSDDRGFDDEFEYYEGSGINSFEDYLNRPELEFDKDFAEWRKDNPGKTKKDFIDDPDGAKEYFSLGMEAAGMNTDPESYFGTSGMRSRSDYDSSLSRNGWRKNGDKWNKGNWEVEVLVDENDRGNRLVARNKEIGETLEQERGPDVGALKHLNVFESILRGSDDAGFDDDSAMRAPGGVRRAMRRAMAGRRSRNERGMRSQSGVISGDRFLYQDDVSRVGRGGKTRVNIGDSQAVSAITWDDNNRDLIVTFGSGRTYTYLGVDDDLIKDLEENPDSVGKIINKIKNSRVPYEEGGDHAPLSTLSSEIQQQREMLGMRSRMAPSSGRIRAAEMEISARPQGMASRRSEGLRDPRFAVPGRDRVDPSDGQLWNRLSDEEKETVANRAVNREKMLLNEFKQRFPRWWDRASKEADKKGWDKDLMKGGNAGWLDELHRFVTKLADDPNYPEKSRTDAEKQFNDLQALFNMRVNRGSHDLLEHLNPTSRRYLFDDARRDDSKKTGISASGKEMKTPSTAPRPFGEPIDVGTPIREQVGQSQKKPLKERLDSYYKRMSDKILYTDPARQARREMRKARRQGINAGGFTESEANPVDDAKRKIRRRKRIKQMRKNRTRDIGSISDSSTGNRVDGRLAHTDSQGSLVFGDKLTSTLATMMANYRTESKLKKTKGSVNKNRALAVLWDGAGYNGTPHVVTAEEFKALHAAGWVPVVRGHGKSSNGVRYANDWLDDPVRFITGQGGEAQGEGEYWARPTQGGGGWFSWMDGSLPTGTVGLLPPSTRRVSLSELGKIKSEHAPLAKSIKAFDAGLPSGEREKMDAEEYVTQLRDHLRSSLGPIYESTMSTKMGQMTSKILESLSGSSDSKKQELLDSLEFLELISRQRTSNSYAPLLGYDTIMADSGVELIHNRTAITIVGDTFTRDDAVNLAKSKA